VVEEHVVEGKTIALNGDDQYQSQQQRYACDRNYKASVGACGKPLEPTRHPAAAGYFGACSHNSRRLVAGPAISGI